MKKILGSNQIIKTLIIIISILFISTIYILASLYKNETNKTIIEKTTIAGTNLNKSMKAINSPIITVIKNQNKEENEEVVEETTANQETTAIDTSIINQKGFSQIATIEIPKTNLNTAILDKVTEEGMKQYPWLLYTTGEFNKSGYSFIAGHNLQNDTIFSNNYKLEVGDEIYITTTDGSRVKYTIYSKFITSPEDTSYLQMTDTQNPEIILSCCTNDEVNRIVVLARTEKSWQKSTKNETNLLCPRLSH